ncbi:MAG: YfcE family phosphodiesterase [Erysipelotrichales bacterium]|nr:YfcE family phosphodiesterase [Erysipelotrichales bacterium]
MKIVVISDTHRDIDSIRLVRYINHDADMFLHCGDSELPEDQIDGFASVKGNCDYFDYPLNKTLKTPLGNIYIEHGHKHALSDEYILSKNAIIFLHGHTHRHYVKKVGNCYVANPGSLIKPRDDSNGTYLIITIDNEQIKFEFKELN